jgi:hypothetical protein
MYAVTGSPSEYAEPETQEEAEPTLYLIERCDAEKEAGGWAFYWYNDGSSTGTVLFDIWGWRGDTVGPLPITLDMDDVFSPAEQECMENWEWTEVPAPFGVRYRTVTEDEFELIWADFNFDIAELLNAGTVKKDHWEVWMTRILNNGIDSHC